MKEGGREATLKPLSHMRPPHNNIPSLTAPPRTFISPRWMGLFVRSFYSWRPQWRWRRLLKPLPSFLEPARPSSVLWPTVQLLKGRSHRPSHRLPPAAGRPNERFLCPPSLRDEPRLKMQICCRMQSAANQPTSCMGGRGREEGNARGGQQMGPPQSKHSTHSLITWPRRPGMGKLHPQSNQVPILRNFLVVKFQLKSNVVPQMRNFSPTLPFGSACTLHIPSSLPPCSLLTSLLT